MNTDEYYMLCLYISLNEVTSISIIQKTLIYTDEIEFPANF